MIAKAKLGMLLFIASEAVFFALLVIAYLYFRAGTAPGPNGRSSLDPLTTAIFTVALLASSGTLWLSEQSLRRGTRGRVSLWLLATVVLGAIFLIGQGLEYTRLFNQDVTISRNLFGTTFFTLTGFHGFHVFCGLVALAILLGFAVAGRFDEGHATAVETVALYWHFVDAVWIVIFCVVYLGTLV